MHYYFFSKQHNLFKTESPIIPLYITSPVPQTLTCFSIKITDSTES